MSRILKKYGKHLASFTILTVLVFLLIPVVQGAGLQDVVDRELNASGLKETFSSSGASDGALAKMIGEGIKLLLGLLGLILVVIIIYAGFIWTTAQGDSKKVDKAKDMIKQAVVGLVIVFAAYAIAQFVLINLSKIASGGTI